MIIYEQIKNMSIEELADFLYYNAEYISAEFGQCSGAENSNRIKRFLESEDGE